MPPVIDQEKCSLCGTCDKHCPLDVLYLTEEKVDIRYPDECWHCGACRQDCPTGAIDIEFSAMMLSV